MSAGPGRRGWGPRLLAILALLGAAALAYVLTNLPVATRVDSQVQPWQAARLETLTIGLDPASLGPENPVISLNGAVGKDVGVWFGKGSRFSDATKAELTALGAPQAAAITPAGWVSRAQGSGRVGVEVILTPAPGARPTLALSPTGHSGSADLVLVAHGAPMTVRITASLDPAAPEPEIVAADKSVAIRMTGEGGVALEVVAPQDIPVTIRLPEDSLSDAEFRMGRIDDETQAAAVPATSLSIGSRRGGERLAACGANPKAIAWTSTSVTLDHCKPVLGLSNLDVTGKGATVEVVGRAFLAVDGDAKVLPLQKVTENPILALVLGAAYAGLGGWAFRTLSGKRDTPA